MEKERELNRMQVERLRAKFTKFFDVNSETVIDFYFFDILSYAGVITEEEADKLTEKFERMGSDLWRVLEEEDKKSLKDFACKNNKNSLSS